MSIELEEITQGLYEKLNLEITGKKDFLEGIKYKACTFSAGDKRIIFRMANTTPKKVGAFVAIWKRNSTGKTVPYEKEDPFDFLVITICHGSDSGQFVFPKSLLIEKGIISSNGREGKRGLRVYAPNDPAANKQAVSTKKWQGHYYLDFSSKMLLKEAKNLYNLMQKKIDKII